MKINLILIVVLFFAVFSCSKDDANGQSNLSSHIEDFPTEALSLDEITSLTFMREEEKLAYDVYNMLYSKWGINLFNNISSSELTHSNAVLTLLTRYGIDDPAEGLPPGVFKDPILQNLYNHLSIQGKISPLEGYIVGATIEDVDIFDLKNWNTKVDNQDIKFVYKNLMRGSRNHLRSFYGHILSAGGTYGARYISSSELDAIIGSPKETGPY